MRVTIENLNVYYGDKQALRDVCMEIGQGELFAVLGPSGCGKSTLLKTVAGLLEQRSGTIRLDDNPIDTIPAHKRGISMVFQDARLFAHMSVLQNVAYPLKIAGMKKPRRLALAREMLEQVHLGDYANCRPHELSGGQQQRVALARALVARPHVWLLDEPFSGLDASLRLDMQALLANLHRQYGVTTVLVTHDVQEALRLSDRMAVMDGGTVLQHGTPREIYEHPASEAVARYFYKDNCVRGHVQGGRFEAPGLAFESDKSDGEYAAYFRPTGLVLRLCDAGAFTVTRVEYLGDGYSVQIQHIERPIALAVETVEPPVAGARAEVIVQNHAAMLYPVVV